MNQSATSLSVVALFENADIVVKVVLLLLLLGSIWSWAVTIDKTFRLRVPAARRASGWTGPPLRAGPKS
jgi:biopolymer transport protein ExbB/TolQ